MGHKLVGIRVFKCWLDEEVHTHAINSLSMDTKYMPNEVAGI